MFFDQNLHHKWRFLKTVGKIIFIMLITSGCVADSEDTRNPSQQQKQQEDTSTNLSKEMESLQPEVETDNHKNRITATVLSVIDGDTLKVRMANGTSEKVRMILIDTPETKHPRLGEQPFGPEASAFTEKELQGKEISLELDIEERDQYGRILAYVWVRDILFNETLLEEGLARVAVFPPNTKYVDQFRTVQKEAQKQGIGIWTIENYVQEDGYQSEGTKQDPPTGNSSSGGSYINDPSDDQETNMACIGKIKGNVNSKIYHVPGGRYYDSVQDNIHWFCSETEAQAAGYRKSKQ